MTDKLESVAKSGIGMLEKWIPPVAGAGLGWMLGDMLSSKVDIPARIAFAVPKSLGSEQGRQDFLDLLLLGAGAGLMLGGVYMVYKGFVSGSGVAERAGMSGAGMFCVRTGIDFVNKVSVL